jgi:hypothetical protein
VGSGDTVEAAVRAALRSLGEPYASDMMLMDFVESPDLADHILELPFRYHLAAAERLAAMGVDMIWAGDVELR